ncbi:nucleotide exchange factor GrpE [Amycolatopsis nigrescens]|uniref:nucleotide exchange factor GrpE n=1 Tax=Amycolatopsis nigrescens TaxID=381445 RepID=UPI00037B5277|nr:nucleotide exchange factor GrpE [Amycolatopsis nigrescens]
MSSWFRRESRAGQRKLEDLPTGKIPAKVIADAEAEMDKQQDKPAEQPEEQGTAERADASDSDVDPVPAVVTHATGAGPGALEQALADRLALIHLCLYAMDRARSGGVVERLQQGLAGIGVTALRPDGQRFDPALHEAGGAVVTDDESLVGTVAETEVVGFSDQDRLLRAPIVTVYTQR